MGHLPYGLTPSHTSEHYAKLFEGIQRLRYARLTRLHLRLQ